MALSILGLSSKLNCIFKSHSRSRPFPGILVSYSRSQISGMRFIIPVPIPKNWECNFHSHSRAQNLGMG